MPLDQWGNQAARDVLVELYGKEPLLHPQRRTIPVTELFQSILGVYTVGFGFGMDDEALPRSERVPPPEQLRARQNRLL